MEHLGDTYREELYALKGAKIALGYQNSIFFSYFLVDNEKRQHFFPFQKSN